MAFVNPENVVKSFDLEPGGVVADFGSGSGAWALAAARFVGPDGKVYAVDVQKEILSALKSRADTEGFLNIEIVWGDIESQGGSGLADESVDFIIMANVLFQADKKEEMVREAFRVLKEGGRLGLIDWGETGLPGHGFGGGPARAMRIFKNEAKKIFLEAGFVFQDEFEAGEHHYGLLFKKS
jgi:ubiquinone/menaquinone biosynthesis C-methylase UbiE